MPEDAEITDAAVGYWAAWHILTNDRQMGAMGGASRIPWASIANYAENYGFQDEFVLSRLLWGMDEVFLEWLAEKQKAPDGD